MNSGELNMQDIYERKLSIYLTAGQDDEGKDLHGKALIIIEKHRKGAVGEIKLDFKPEYSSFEDPLEPKPFIEGELFESGLKTK